MSNELYKEALKYHIKRVVRKAVFFAIIFAIIYGNIFSYKPGWYWITESCFLILWLCYCGRNYKKYKLELTEMIDKVFKYKK